MSIIGDLNVIPFSLTGLQNINATINGYSPVSSVNIVGSQTAYLSSTGTPDSNGNVNLDLHIPTGTSSAVGLNYNLLQTANTWLGSQNFSYNDIKMNLSQADTGYYISYNPSTKTLTYNPDTGSDLLGANNVWTGTNSYDNIIYLNSITNGGTTSRSYISSNGTDTYVIYVPRSGLSTFWEAIKWKNDGSIYLNGSGSAITYIDNIVNANNGIRAYYSNGANIRFQATSTGILMVLPSSNTGNSLQINTADNTISYTTNLSVAQSLLSQNNSWSGTNTYTNTMYFGDTTFGIYKAYSNVLRIGHISGGAPTSQSFFDFDNTGGSALYGNNYFGLNTPTFNIAGNTYVASGKFIKFNDSLKNNKLILWGDDNNNAYSLGIDGGTQLYNSGGIHSFWTGSRAYNPCKITSDGVECQGTGGKYGTHGTTRGLYVCGDWYEVSNGAEFRHSNGTQGVGIGYAGIYATGSNPNQNLSFKSKGASSSLNYYVENQLVQACSASNFNIYSPVMTWANGGFMGQYGNTFNAGERWTNNWCRFAESQSNEARALGFARAGDVNLMVSLAPFRFWMPFRYVGDTFTINYQGYGADTCVFFSGGTYFTYINNSGNFLCWIRHDNGDRFVVWCNPNGSYFYVNNSNNYGIASDARLKKDISPIDVNKSKEFILKITPSIFRYKVSDEHDSKSIGFIAQHVLTVAKTEAQKNIVNRWREYEDAMAKGEEPIEEYDDEKEKDKDGKPIRKTRKIYLGVSEVKFIPEIIGTIQVMNKENEELKAEVASLKERLDRLEQIISKLNV